MLQNKKNYKTKAGRKLMNYMKIGLKGKGSEEEKKVEVKAEPENKPTNEVAPREEKPKEEKPQEKESTIVKVAKTAKSIWDSIPPPRDVAPPKIRKFIEDHKDWSFSSMMVCRVPIISVIQKTINALRKLTRQKRDEKYDKLFHLYILITLKSPDGKTETIRMERNHVFEIRTVNASDDKPKDGACKRASPPKDYFGIVVNKAVSSNGKQNFFIYDSTENNCQDFVISILKAGGVLTSELQTFVKQDVTQLFGNSTFFSKIAKYITDKASGIDRAVFGEGQKKGKGKGKQDTKYECPCGGKYILKNEHQHAQTDRHQKYLKLNKLI